MESQNYYELLGVSPKATEEDVRVAYKELARVYHPDSHFFDEILESASVGAAEQRRVEQDRFKLITAAYHTLIDPERRNHYNETVPTNLRGWGDTIEGRKDTAELLRDYRRSAARSSSGARGIFGVVPEPQVLSPEPIEEERLGFFRRLFTALSER